MHPLVRSAVYHAAPPVQRRQAHRALAMACDTDRDSDARAWHLATAAAGPDEAVAAEQVAAADRAGERGSCAAAAALLERAAQLTPDRDRRVERRLSAVEAYLLAGSVDRADALLAAVVPDLTTLRAAADAKRLEGKIHFARGSMGDAASALVDSARRLLPLDPSAATKPLLSALDASVFAGWGDATLLHDIARTARERPAGGPPDSATELLLEGYTLRITDGYARAVPPLRMAIKAFLVEDLDPDVALRRLELAAVTAADLLDDASVDLLVTDWVDRARRRGALSRLAGALAFRSALVDAPAGRLAAARAAESEARELAEATHNPAIVPPTGVYTLHTLALSGHEAEARATAAAVARDAPGRRAAGELAVAAYFLGVLEIGLGNYAAAVDCLETVYADDTPLVGPRRCPTWWRPPPARGGRRWPSARWRGWTTARPRQVPI